MAPQDILTPAPHMGERKCDTAHVKSNKLKLLMIWHMQNKMRPLFHCQTCLGGFRL